MRIIVGEKYNRLTILGKSERPKHSLCECECGTIKEIANRAIISGDTKSCGCLRSESPVVDQMIGNKYDKWTVLEQTGTNKVLCECECGTIRNVVASDIKDGRSKSCGCYHKEVLKKYNTYELIDDNTVKVFFDCGLSFICDIDDWEYLKQHKWFLAKRGSGYARACIDGKKISFHRAIKDFSGTPLEIDHINGDTFNNTKANLRTATRMDNAKNQKMFITNTSGTTGVYRWKDSGEWYASITHDKIKTYLGTHATYDDAVEARRKAEVKYFGEFARKKQDGEKGENAQTAIDALQEALDNLESAQSSLNEASGA